MTLDSRARRFRPGATTARTLHRSPFLPLVLAGSAALLGTSAAAAQTLPDLQPGRNFTAAANFGTSRSENIDPGDCDNDGDLDVIVANGGDGMAQQNRIYINLGGLQGGALGTFADETATRFAGVTVDTSRDIEFVDFENDGDLDICVANRGTTANGGEPSRFYTNLGGLQAGTLGYYLEDTDLRWGTLTSVPLPDQVFGGNQGPFRAYCGDLDFADFDDDGHLDLFFSSYGNEFDGNIDSRIFLNDGSGVFNEEYPWANPGADIKTHTIDMDLVDLDGDFDIDVAMSSRNSASRTYMNNLYNGIGSTLFNDVTQSALNATGATGSNNVNYETEYADVDGDGDFDLWMVNYDNNLDRLLRNNGFTQGVGYSFSEMNSWIKNDPNVDEIEADFLDYDGDGDLDVFLANFTGTNYLYQSGLAQGLDFNSVGLYHRTGFASGLSPNPELSAINNSGQSLDADTADVDNDGDDDILIANDANQPNYLNLNVLGVPDTHAPTFYKITQVAAAVPNGSPQVIHAQIRDNASYYLTNFYETTLHYTVNGGAPQTVPMFAQGSMQFRAVLPAQNDAVITYHVECTDLAGNTGVSAEVCFTQGSVASPWTDLGFGLAGVNGVPTLAGTGTLIGGCPLTIALSNAAPNAAALLFVSLTSVPVPFKGGTLAAFPPLPSFPLVLATDGAGTLTLPTVLPTGINGLSLDLFLQYAVADAAAVNGVALSHALRGDVP